MLKNATDVKEILYRQNSAAISHQISPDSLIDFSAGNCQRVLVDKSDGDALQIKSDHGGRVALCTSPIVVTVTLTVAVNIADLKGLFIYKF
jgi:hypothetical protein